MAPKKSAAAKAAAAAVAKMKEDAAKKASKKLTPSEKAMLEKTARASAHQAIRENHNFRGFSSTQVHSTLVGGKSLFTRVYEAKYANLTGKPAPPFGSNFFKTLSSQYRSDGDGAAVPSLVCGHQGLPLDQAIPDAWLAWNQNPRNAGPIVAYFSLGTTVTSSCRSIHIFLFFCVCVGWWWWW